MATTAPVIDVIDPSGQTHRVVGRAADWVQWILMVQDKINAMDTGNTFRMVGKLMGDIAFLDSILNGHVRLNFGPGGTAYEATKVVKQ